jgi:hypothetical protein
MNLTPLLLYPFCPVGIIPETRGNDLFFKLCQLLFLAVYLKDAPSRPVYDPLSPEVSV